MRAHERPVLRDEGSGVEVRFAHTGEDIARAVALLDEVESRSGAPMVDESERQRLDRVVHHDEDPADHWHPLLAWREVPVGYAGLSLDGVEPTADVVLRDVAGLVPLLRGLRQVAAGHASQGVDDQRLVAWLRHLDDDVLVMADLAGWSLRRRLLVLRRGLVGPGGAGASLPPGVRLREHDGGVADDTAIAEVLASAYAGTPDADWTADEVARRRGYPWFRQSDLLVAEVDGEVAGIHWTKRRDGGVGEVYNLAVRPGQQGSGLGAALLDAGLAHLADVGCTSVVLWVDEANAGGRHLYAGRGFEHAWSDVALACAVCD